MHPVFRTGIFLALLCLLWAALPWLFLSGDPHALEKLSQWGSSFGGLSALISAFGFLAVMWSIQRQQVDQHRQRFHGQYIELLKLLREVREDVNFSHSAAYLSAKGGTSVVNTGVMAFQAAWKEVICFVANSDDNEQVKEWYIQKVHLRYESNLGPYFRLVYTILHMIREDSILDAKEKARYGNILRSPAYELRARRAWPQWSMSILKRLCLSRDRISSPQIFAGQRW